MAYYNKYYTYPDMFLWQDETYAGCMNGAGPLFLKLGELIREEESKTPPADRFPGREDLVSDAVNRMAYYPDYVEGWKKRGMHFSCSGMMGPVMAPTAVKEHALADADVLFIPYVDRRDDPKQGMELLAENEDLLETAARENMDVFYTAGALIDHVEEADGVVTAYTGKDKVFTVGGDAGPMAPPSPVVEVTFDAANVENVTDGCIAVYWEGADGWHLQAADPVTGKLTDGADHQYIMLEAADGSTIECQDAAMYSRGFSDGNRPGQFVNTQMNFALNDVEVTVWFIPGTLGTDNPMPIGITGLDNAHVRLERAIAFVQDVVDHTVVAESEEDAAAKAAEQDLGEDFHWVTEAVTADHVSEITGKDSKGVLDMLNEKVAAAQALLDGEASPAELDQAAYELFIAMWGSSSDIGAVFSGAAEEGFYDVADAGAHALPAAVLK